MAVEVHGTLIRIPQGDTGNVTFVADRGEIADGDKGVFTLARRDGTALLRKRLPPDPEAGAFHMAFVYEDTAKLRPGSYEWSFRVVRGGAFDANGRLTGAQGSHTAVLKGQLNVMEVAGGAR